MFLHPFEYNLHDNEEGFQMSFKHKLTREIPGGSASSQMLGDYLLPCEHSRPPSDCRQE
jgi:hypothetical protein